MGIKKINSRKIIGGVNDTNNDVLIVYNMFSYIILYISYILFGIAILIFINSCFNLNKVSTGREGTLIDKPIFEYLKEDDILYIDEYLLNVKSPIFITIISIFSISLFSIICIRLWWNNYKKDIQFPYEIDNKTFIIASLSYLFTFIIIITYNEFRRIYVNETFLGCDKEYKNDITDDILALEKEDSSSYLKELKKIIINMLENDKTYKNDADIKSKLEKSNDIDVSSIAKGLKLEEGENQISILKLILEIYKKDYKDKEKNKYIKYINDYFDLLIDNKRSNYTKYYILGLAKNIPDKINNVCNIFKNSLDDIKNKIYAYFVVIILFFCLCYIVVPLIIFWNLDRNYFNKFIIDISYNIFSITILFTLFFTFIIYFALFYTKGIR
jgi:hypothetical protein